MDISFSHQQLWVADKEGNLQLYDASLGQFKHIKASSIIYQAKFFRTFSNQIVILYIDDCTLSR